MARETLLVGRKRIVILVLMLCALIFSTQDSVWAGAAQTKKMLAEKEAYFKDPKHDVLVLIEAVDRNGKSYPNQVLEITVTDALGRNSDTYKTYTPYVVRYPMDELVSGFQQNYDKLSASDKQQTLLTLPQMCTLVLMAQEQNGLTGIKGTVYYAGKEQTYDCSAVEYGAIHLTYTLPISELLKK